MESAQTENGFGKAVRLERMRLGLSQDALAERAALGRPYIMDIERGAQNVSLETIYKLAHALGVSAEALFVRPSVKPEKQSESAKMGREYAAEYKVSRTNLVHCFIKSANSTVSPGELNLANVVKLIGFGLSVQELDELREGLGWSVEQLVPKLGLSMATFHRRKLAGRLSSDESDKVIRYARLLAKAIEVLGGQEEARHWLNKPQFGLGGAVPLDYAATEVGAREVEDLLGRIDYGVYS